MKGEMNIPRNTGIHALSSAIRGDPEQGKVFPPALSNPKRAEKFHVGIGNLSENFFRRLELSIISAVIQGEHSDKREVKSNE